MKYCTNCGTQNQDEAQFCTSCGAKIAVPSPNAGVSLAAEPAGAVFKFACPACHQSLEAPRELAGSQIDCPTCRQPINIPFPGQAKIAGLSIEGPDEDMSPPADSQSPEARDTPQRSRMSKWLILACLGFLACVAFLTKEVLFGVGERAKNFAYIGDGGELGYTDKGDNKDFACVTLEGWAQRGGRDKRNGKSYAYLSDIGKAHAYIADDGKNYAYVTDSRTIPVTRFLKSHKQARNYSYLAGSEAVTITRYTGKGGAVTVPGKIEGLPVTSIGHGAFNGCASLTSVTIPYGVTNIGNTAFMGCFNLTSVTIPNGVTSMGTETFHGCTKLTRVTIPESVTKIERWVFFHCESLAQVRIPNSVTSIGAESFASCKSLTSVAIPNGVTSIQSFTFSDCATLTDVIIPGSVTSIEREAFRGCRSLTSVTIPSTTEIGKDAFPPDTRIIRSRSNNTVPPATVQGNLQQGNPVSAQNTISFENKAGKPALVKLLGPTPNDILVADGAKQSVRAAAGVYTIKVRYGVPGNYRYTKGQEFTVTQTATSTSRITITLHPVANGNYETSPITEQEFGGRD